MADWSKLKIFFPGPTWVAPEVREAMSAQVLHHRTAEFQALHRGVIPRLRRLLETRSEVFLVTASGTGLMEAAARNLIAGRALCVANGAFGERLHAIAVSNGKEADLLAFPWGKGFEPEKVREKLRSQRYDTLLFVHNETSTGVMNPLPPMAEVAREFPDLVVAVDAVSSMAGARIPVDELGFDFVFAGVQKCFALPPGLSVVAVSPKALERARSVPARGTYFDLVATADAASHDETPWTPSVPHVAALAVQCERMEKEGFSERFARHDRMAEMTRAWAVDRGFGLYAEDGHRSSTVTAIANTRGIDVKALLSGIRERGFVAANGYGKLKGNTFRIGHMGDLTETDVQELLQAMDAVLADPAAKAAGAAKA